MELHTAADGSQVLYAVLEDTNEIASFRVEGAGDSLRLVSLEVAQMLRGEGHGPLPKPDQAVSLAFVPWNALQGNAGAVAASEGIAGLAYVGLRGSERIVTLLWDGKRLTRLDEPDVPGWRGRGIDCAGSRPRHLLAIGNLLLAANEASNNVAIFRLSADGEPNLAATLPSGAPTVFVRL